MRDPLHWLPIRWKLTLTFVGLCLLAYGVGGWMVSHHAQETLRAEILERLRSSSQAEARAVEQALARVGQRAEDFSSDGLIRSETARLASLPAPLAATETATLRRHLAENKLPLAAELRDLRIHDTSGRALVGVRDAPPPEAEPLLREGLLRDGPWIGGFFSTGGAAGAPSWLLLTPLRSLDGRERVGTLVCQVDAATWLRQLPRADAPGGSPRAWLTVRDDRGASVGLAPTSAAGDAADPDPVYRPAGRAGEPGPGPGLDAIAHAWPLSTPGWSVELAVNGPAALSPVSSLQSRFLAAGLLIAAAAAVLLFFPLRFLVRPLAVLREAAVRLTEGDHAVRVRADTKDEIGDLAAAYNHMAGAVQERTARLEHATADLQARKDDLSRERDRLDTVVRSIQDAVVLLDDAGRVVLSNAAAAPLLAVLASRGGRDAAVRCAEDDDGHTRDCVACLAKTDRGRQTCRIDVDARVYEVTASRIPSVGGWMGRLLVAKDVTEFVTIDEREAHQARLAVVGEVAAVVAHELNNPLSAVNLYAQMMETELPPDSPFREHVSVIRRNTDTCKRAIRGLLDYAYDAGPEIADVDLDELLDEVARFVRPLLRRAGLELERAGRLSDPVIRADEVRLRQVFVNLVLNAIQAAAGVGHAVTIAVREASGGRAVEVEVRDDGPGVPPELRQRIFESFVTTKGPGQGTGLGLAISSRIVEAHGGTLTLERAEPGDTAFRVRLQRTPKGGLLHAAAPLRRDGPGGTT